MNRLSSAQVNALLQSAGPAGAVYLIGAGGCGMSGLGHLLLDLGHPVFGSDLVANEAVEELRRRGATLYQGHSAEQLLAAKPDLVVYSTAIPLHNPELKAAQQMPVPIVRRAVLLAALLHRQRGICVAGMHGKTTTTALLAFALENLGLNPSYAVGAAVPQLIPSARMGNPLPSRAPFVPRSDPRRGDNSSSTAFRDTAALSVPTFSRAAAFQDKWFVVEADESDGTLSAFEPEHAIVLNVDEEHLDFYASLEAICLAFQDFARHTRDRLIYCADDPRLVELFGERPGAISFGYQAEADYRIVPMNPGGHFPARDSAGIERSEDSIFELWHGRERMGEFVIGLMGEKNASNAAAVITLLHQLGFDPAAIARAIRPFKGAARRQHELFHDQHFRIFDDYGHHPREISATLRALKDLGAKRLLAAFQPHRFTRTQHLMAQFATCFKLADKLWITEIYPASEPAIAGISGAVLAAAVRAQGQPVEFMGSLAELVPAVRRAMEPGDIVLFIGAGDITETAHQLADRLSIEKAAAVSPASSLFLELTSQLSPKTVLRRDEPMAKHTTLRVGGPADFYVEPGSESDLAGVLQFCAGRQLPFHLIGRGSNLLVRDGGLRGVVICLAHPSFCSLDVNDNIMMCGAGARLKAAVAQAQRHELGGLEFLAGIPGTIGGALRMNAGAMGNSMFAVVERVRCMDYSGRIEERTGAEITAHYRDCPFFHDRIALAAELRGYPASPESIEQKLNAFNQRRGQSQPAAPSAGCVFKNTFEIPAGKLIEELALKGTRMGGAMISEVHGNFIVNTGNAKARDILDLIEFIKQRARTTRGIHLETEVQVVGEESAALASVKRET